MTSTAGSAPPAQLPDDVVRLTRVLAVGSLFVMIVLGLAWELWLAPTGNRTWALKVLPLALPIVGLLKHRMYTYRWVTLLVWLYFMEGVVRATTESGVSAVLATLQVLLCLVLFAASALHVRWRLKVARRTADGSAPTSPGHTS